jgi:hypothetical protein
MISYGIAQKLIIRKNQKTNKSEQQLDVNRLSDFLKNFWAIFFPINKSVNTFKRYFFDFQTMILTLNFEQR